MTELGQAAAHFCVNLPGQIGGAIVLAWAGASDVGHKRDHNEDSFLTASPIFAVADGMGGHSSGDVASAAVVKRLANAASTDFIKPGDIEHALRAATMDIAMAEDERQVGVGTTVTGAALALQSSRPHWNIFNIGDSRVYQFEHNELVQVTVDHSVVQELVDAGLLSAKDALSHPDGNVITRAVGFNAEPMPDFWSVPLCAGMRLLLCSDGLTKEVSQERLRLHLAAGLSPSETVTALVDAALASGGRDNVTVVIVDVVDYYSGTPDHPLNGGR